jgi:hypoxanthine phosphoribosyltransferase
MNTDPALHILISRQEIADANQRLAAQIQADYQDKNPLLIGVLKGAIIFFSDLVRYLDMPLEIDFIRLASYGGGTRSSGKITLVQDLVSSLKDRHIIIVEDIVDTGQSTRFLIDTLRKRAPASIKLCALIDKPSRRVTPVNIDYRGFSIPDKFIIGYGMDCAEKYRNLPDICWLEDR